MPDCPTPDNSTTRRERRAALALALDGVQPTDVAGAEKAVRVAMALSPPRWTPILERMQRAPDGTICLVESERDGFERLLHVLGIRPRVRPVWDDQCAAARLIFLGCPDGAFRLDYGDADAFLRKGGVLVSSDHAASLAALAPLLPTVGRGGPRRARVEWRVDEPPINPLLPAVFLPAGHDQLAPPSPGHDARTLAIDALTDIPLAVLVPVGDGALLHATPHWFQDGPAQMTAVERRPAQSVPAYATLGADVADLTVGDIQAAEAMLTMLLAGLGVVAKQRATQAAQRSAGDE